VGKGSATFESLGKAWSYNTSCTVTLIDVEVAFDVTGANGTTAQVTAIENPALDTVLKVTVTNIP
jgi:hypothetical protein